MKFFSLKTIFEVLAQISINITSGWFGILIITPGFFGVRSLNEYKNLLTTYIPFAIVNLLITFWLIEYSKKI
ncbi:MAG: hypothetical protein N2593_00860 [Patescibacteria group bacterium]|nr:hypothetical protein [Patescibacteria group bacterium]MCX7955647.1 hypothetical protein [Patescibacteria group bacterium]